MDNEDVNMALMGFANHISSIAFELSASLCEQLAEHGDNSADQCAELLREISKRSSAPHLDS